jgi:hypothetical protein
MVVMTGMTEEQIQNRMAALTQEVVVREPHTPPHVMVVLVVRV